jgi:GTP-binding protein
MLIDDVTITVRAGDGGRGAVRFNKNLHQYGPVGGSGGDGGSVYIAGSSDLSILQSYRYKKVFAAENGGDGRGQFRDGVDAKDITLLVPVGTSIFNRDTKETLEVVTVGKPVLVAKGGRGGRGNFHFRSSTNTRPKEFEEGKPGEHFSFRLTLKLIADVGLIGLPNAGKTSLLNELTRAQAKTANYAFTTLEPNLGNFYGLILADIPGLIEGASGGKGLGTKFLRHIERTHTLFHLVAADSDDLLRNYKTVRAELGVYDKALLEKREHVFISKSDTVSALELKKKVALFKKEGISAMPFSIHDLESIEKIEKLLRKLLATKMEG